MKGFIILLCSVGVALAAPQYNYSPGQSGSSFSSHHSSFSGGSGGHHGGGSLGGGSFGGGSLGGGSLGGGSFGGGSSGFSQSSGSSGFGVSGGGQELITKQFFIHSAPEEQDEIGADKLINLGPGRKHYRVVFIKAPHQGVQAGKVRFIAPADEEKTVIYVLSKKSDLADIQADVQQAHSEPTKPEVHFIKYKTNEEAQHAQRQIQAQYDQLGGTSQVSDEGVAPVSSVIGTLGGGGTSGGGSFTSSGGSIGGGSLGGGSLGGGSLGTAGIGGGGYAPAASYLPPSH